MEIPFEFHYTHYKKMLGFHERSFVESFTGLE